MSLMKGETKDSRLGKDQNEGKRSVILPGKVSYQVMPILQLEDLMVIVI